MSSLLSLSMKNFDREAYLSVHIPHRMLAVHLYRRILASPGLRGKARDMVITLDGEEFVRGHHFAFTNPCVETGILFVRVLLEFAGLRLQKSNIVARDYKPSGTDVQIEDFSFNNTPLRTVTLKDISALGIASEQDCINALICGFKVAHKGVAHLTIGHDASDDPSPQLLLSADIALAILERHLFGALCIPVPKLPMVTVPRS